MSRLEALSSGDNITMSKKNPTAKELKAMKAELKRLNKFITEQGDDNESTSGFGRVIGFPNEKNTKEYGTEYTYCEFVDANDAPLGSPRGNEEAEAVLKQLKGVRWGKNKRGKPRFDKAVKAWSMQTEHVPSFVVMGTKNGKGVFKATK